MHRDLKHGSHMKYYYANAQNQAVGPVSLEDIQQLLKTGVVTPSTQIIAEGATQWSPLASLLNPSQPRGPQTLEEAATTPADIAGLGLEWVRSKTGPVGFNKTMRFFTGAGQLAILIGACIAFIYAVLFSFRTNSFKVFIGGVAALIVILVLQFVAKTCLEGCRNLLDGSPSRMPSFTIPNSAALLIIVGALASIILGLVFAISENNFAAFLIPVVLGCAYLFIAWVALHPSIVGVSLGEGSIGDEASAIVSLGLKACLATIPYAFFIFAVSGTISLFFCLINEQVTLPVLRLPLPDWLMQFAALEGALTGLAALISATVLPFAAYIIFLLAHLAVDVTRAILSINRTPNG